MAVYGINFAYDKILSDVFNLVMCSIGDNGSDDELEMGLDIEAISDDTTSPYKVDYGIKYTNVLSFPMTIAHRDGTYFGRTQIRDISRWLTGKQKPCWLEIFDNEYEDIHFLCRVTEIRKIKINGNVVGFRLTWTCTSSFAFSDEQEEVINIKRNANKFHIYNDSDDESYLLPLVKVTVNDSDSLLSIKNLTTKDDFELKNIRNGDIIIIDNYNQIIYVNGKYKHIADDFNLVWIGLKQGLNDFEVNLECNIEFTYRFTRKVGDF